MAEPLGKEEPCGLAGAGGSCPRPAPGNAGTRNMSAPPAFQRRAMAKNLLIVESPAKTKTLKKFLGRQYAVEASVGHIRDLVKKDMGIGPDYEPRYEMLAAKKDVVKKLREAAKEAETVYLAPDPDREGEAIAWHIAEVLKDSKDVRRVTFNEITKRAVLKALENPRHDRPQEGGRPAGPARPRPDDGLPPLAAPLGEGQAGALRRPRPVGRPEDGLRPPGRDRRLPARGVLEPRRRPQGRARRRRSTPACSRIDGKKAEVGNGEDAARHRPRPGEPASSWSARWSARSRASGRRRRSSPAACSRRRRGGYGFSVKRTMGLAQGLYEGRRSATAARSASSPTCAPTPPASPTRRSTAGASSSAPPTAPDALPEKPNVYPSKKGAQDAHEAIRPTSFDLPPDAVRGLPQGRRVQALQADLGPLHRLPDAARGLRRHPGGHRERPLRPARLGQGAEARPASSPSTARRPDEDAAAADERPGGRMLPPLARGRDAGAGQGALRAEVHPAAGRSTARRRWSRRWRRTASAAPRPTPPSSPC